jgi:hypothetical protein
VQIHPAYKAAMRWLVETTLATSRDARVSSSSRWELVEDAGDALCVCLCVCLSARIHTYLYVYVYTMVLVYVYAHTTQPEYW